MHRTENGNDGGGAVVEKKRRVCQLEDDIYFEEVLIISALIGDNINSGADSLNIYI